MQHLAVYAGRQARTTLEQQGWNPEIFSLMIGASGGAKMLGITGLDQFLFGDYLQRSNHPMHLLGSSIGSWRHAALTCKNPLTALKTLQAGYLNQYYEDLDKITPADVSRVSKSIMDEFLGPEGAQSLCAHSRFTSHIVTARGRGPTASGNPVIQGSGQALAALSNVVARGAMQAWFQRVIFTDKPGSRCGLPFADFNTIQVQLTPENTTPALHASGSIPFVLNGERDINGAPLGQYWDGGIIDYHFDFNDYSGDGLALYPHFGAKIIPGWFDKFLPWRGTAPELLDRVVLLCPSEEYLTTLPGGKIPDRRDFPKMTHAERVSTWQKGMDASQRLADDFAALVDGPDPLAGVRSFS